MRPSVEFIDRAIQAAEAGERADLVARLQQNRRRLLDPRVRVLVVGEFKQGKSLLVNALVTAPVCPVDDDVATAVPTVVTHGEQPSAALVWLSNTNGHRAVDAAEPDYETVPVALEDLDKHLSEAADRGKQRRLVRAEVTLPRAVLARGLVLVDTPGVGGLG
ncbi:MAG: dynamin family protein, partial [Actinobacteria bacterium]|nr:dynamin family protein [Actinomycetota bacterium]